MKKKKLSNQQKSGFKVPQDYFEDLEETLMRKISQETSAIDNLKSVPGFVVPEGYFEELEKKILQKIPENGQKGKVISIVPLKSFYYAAAVAALVAVLFSTSLFNTPAPEYTMDSVEISAIEDYIDKGYMDFSFDEISTYITDEGNPLENLNASELSDEAVFYYLSEDVEDPGLLIE